MPIEFLAPIDLRGQNKHITYNNKLDLGARTLALVQEMYCLWSTNKDDKILSNDNLKMIQNIIQKVDINLYDNISKVSEIISNVTFLTNTLLQENEYNETTEKIGMNHNFVRKKDTKDFESYENNVKEKRVLENLLEKAENIITLLNKEESGILHLFPFPIFTQLYGVGMGTGVGSGVNEISGGANDNDKDSYLSSIISLLFIMTMTKDVIKNQSAPVSSRFVSGPPGSSVSGSSPASNDSSMATSLFLRALCCGSELSKIAILSCILDIAHRVRPNNNLFTSTLDEYGDNNCCDLISSYFCDERFTVPYWLCGYSSGIDGDGVEEGGDEDRVVLAGELFHMIVTALATPAFVQGLFLFCILPYNDDREKYDKGEREAREVREGRCTGEKGGHDWGVNKQKMKDSIRVKNLSIALLEPLLGSVLSGWDMKKNFLSNSVNFDVNNVKNIDFDMNDWTHLFPLLKLLEWSSLYADDRESKPLPLTITSFIQVWYIFSFGELT